MWTLIATVITYTMYPVNWWCSHRYARSGRFRWWLAILATVAVQLVVGRYSMLDARTLYLMVRICLIGYSILTCGALYIELRDRWRKARRMEQGG